jgi:hypothetical protein
MQLFMRSFILALMAIWTTVTGMSIHVGSSQPVRA